MDKIIEVCLIENEKHSLEDLKHKLEFKNIDEENLEFEKIKNKLCKRGILKTAESLFYFKFVGICLVNNIVIKIIPKYFQKEEECDFKKILKLLIEYSARETLTVKEEAFLSFNINDNNENLLTLIKFLVDDYFYNGLYLKKEKRNFLNGFGEIDWNKTIEQNKVLFNQKNQPIYTEIQTTESTINYNENITKVHKSILNECFDLLKEIKLLDLFAYQVEFFDIEENFDNDFKLDILTRELSMQFEDRKTNLLKSMINFINRKNDSKDDVQLTLYGTKYFYIIWEKVNSYVFNNEYKELSKHISKIQWENNLIKKELDTNQEVKIKPDILKRYKDLKQNIDLIIIDAKYYNIHSEHKPSSYDVIKQYVYELAFNYSKEKNKEFNIKSIYNIFLYPNHYHCDKKYACFGQAKFDIFGLKPIKNIYISDDLIFDRYINMNPFKEENIKEFCKIIKYRLCEGSFKLNFNNKKV